MASDNNVKSIRETLVSCLEQQLNEFEILKSMYPGGNEIIMTDHKVLDEMNSFIDNRTEYSPSNLDFVLNLFIDNLKVEICATLPSLYPVEEPDVFIRCNQLDRFSESLINKNLSGYLKENHNGEVCLYNAINWLQDNILMQINNISQVDLPKTDAPPTDDKFVRYWIHSHHIYNKKKREEIQSKAKDFNLTGFCLPGKPGIICVEGLESNCKEWWKLIKSMCWKKITIRKTEEFYLDNKIKEQKFEHFKELHFHSNSSNGKHADMSAFSKYMENHGLIGTFNDFFGLVKENL